MNAVEAEINLADEMIRDAELMFREGRKRSTANRGYYAMFHAVKAILLNLGTDCQTHGGAMNRFGEHVIMKGLMDKSFAKSLQRAYQLREKSDYHSIINLEQDDVERVIKESKEFVMEVKKVLIGLQSNMTA
ncbi:MAG: HEPN domain-containing protein [bacterium]|nr:HEPN domain-containing protein [bacterium]